MIIHLPDPHPGRCNNMRRIGDSMERCLDYEGVQHVCSFREPPKPVTLGWSSGTSFAATPPKRWVKPT